MKLIFFLLIIFFLGPSVNAQKENCKKVKTGTFKSTLWDGIEKFETWIYRNKDKQVEEHRPKGLRMEFTVKWTSDCTYELSKPVILSGHMPDVTDEQVIYVKILEVNKQSYTAEVASNYNNQKIIMKFSIEK